MDINLEATAFNLVAGALGGFLCLNGLVSSVIKERLFLGEPPFAILIGIALERLHVIPQNLIGSPDGTQDRIDEFSLGFSRFILGVQLVILGIELPYRYVWHELLSLAILLLPVMLMMWLVTTGLTMLVLPGVSFLAALVIASCATPTDPVLSNAIVTGSFADRHISPRIRNLISAESGANDGFAYPFLFLALRLLKMPTKAGAVWTWLLKTVVYQVGGAIALGALIGYIANRLLRWSAKRSAIDMESFLCFGVSVGIFTIGIAGFLDLDDLLAAFAAGNAVTWDDWYRRETEEYGLSSELSLLLDTSFFMYVGATIPWESFHSHAIGLKPGMVILLAILVLLFRRLPAMLLAYRFIPRIKTWSEAALVGYFGPIGAGAIFYASLVLDQVKDDAGFGTDGTRIVQLVKPVTYALVLASIVGHSMAIPLVKLIFVRFDIGNIKLIGNEADHIGSDDGGDNEERQEASSEHGQEGLLDGTEQIRPGAPGNLRRDAHAPLYLYPRGERSHLVDGQEVDKASWRVSGRHVPSVGYHYLGDDGTGHGSGNWLSRSRRNRYYQERASQGNDLPEEWNARVRYLDEETGNAGQPHDVRASDRLNLDVAGEHEHDVPSTDRE